MHKSTLQEIKHKGVAEIQNIVWGKTSTHQVIYYLQHMRKHGAISGLMNEFRVPIEKDSDYYEHECYDKVKKCSRWVALSRIRD